MPVRGGGVRMRMRCGPDRRFAIEMAISVDAILGAIVVLFLLIVDAILVANDRTPLCCLYGRKSKRIETPHCILQFADVSPVFCAV